MYVKSAWTGSESAESMQSAHGPVGECKLLVDLGFELLEAVFGGPHGFSWSPHKVHGVLMQSSWTPWRLHKNSVRTMISLGNFIL